MGTKGGQWKAASVELTSVAASASSVNQSAGCPASSPNVETHDVPASLLLLADSESRTQRA
jgi:hypothetical protein